MHEMSNLPHPSSSVVAAMLGLLMTMLGHLGLVQLDPDSNFLLIHYLIDHASLILGVAGRVAAARRIKA